MRRVILISTLLLVAIFTIIPYVYAESAKPAYNYSTTSKITAPAYLDNSGTYAANAYAQTRPTTGQGGVLLTVEYLNGTVIAAGVFPYQASRDRLVARVPASYIARVGIQPVTSGQRVSGTLHYGWQ